jgi:hypothetical protein
MNTFRFFLFEAFMALLAVGTGWLGRRILGRLLRGPVVLVWGAIFGLLSMIGFGMFFVQVPFFADFIDLNGDLVAGARIAFLRFWDTGLIGGLIGALIASFPRWNQKRKKPEDQPQA